MEYTRLQDKCRGSIIGGAVGDALGYEVEFLSLRSIRRHFGEKGITRFVPDTDGITPFSDDTQMILFTCEGLLNGVVADNSASPEVLLPYIQKAYLNWYRTQADIPQPLEGSRLSDIRRLWSRRAPGMTCMGALASLADGREVCNNSKGCGGVMRVAPIGIFAAAHPDILSPLDTLRLAGMAAEITHKHIAGTLASSLQAMIVRECILAEKLDPTAFQSIVGTSMKSLEFYYSSRKENFMEFSDLISRAVELGLGNIPETDAIRTLGEGWVGDEAIAIAIFAVVRHIGSFEDCIICAVNHDGDSDSTGSIAGNIIGAILGYSAIPACFLDTLELRTVLLSSADALCAPLTGLTPST